MCVTLKEGVRGKREKSSAFLSLVKKAKSDTTLMIDIGANRIKNEYGRGPQDVGSKIDSITRRGGDYLRDRTKGRCNKGANCYQKRCTL